MSITIETGYKVIGNERRLALCEWLRAHDIDPHTVPAGEPIEVDTDNAVIRFKQTVDGPDGKPVLDPDARNALLMTNRTIPLLSPPPGE